MPEIREITRAQEERRLITVLFADLVGFTSLAERLDPEESRDLVKSLLNQLGNIVQVNGGYVDKFLGDGLIALFGAPTAHEDDPRRAIQSGLAMQALFPPLGRGSPAGDKDNQTTALRLRIGINTGETVVGDFSESGKSDYTAIGDTVNTAQRLETIAQPGQIIVAHSTQQLARNHFLFRQLPAVQLKGKQAYIQPYEVLKARTSPVLFTTPFVNRVKEITRLKAILDRVIEQRVPGAVILYGEPGIGKSRLLWEFRQYMVDSPYLIRGLSARCYSVANQPYGLLNQIISSAAGIGASDTQTETQAKLKGYAQEVLIDEPLAHHFLGLFLGLRYPDLPDGKAGSPLEYLGAKEAELTGFILLKKLFETQVLNPPASPTLGCRASQRGEKGPRLPAGQAGL